MRKKCLCKPCSVGIGPLEWSGAVILIGTKRNGKRDNVPIDVYRSSHFWPPDCQPGAEFDCERHAHEPKMDPVRNTDADTDADDIVERRPDDQRIHLRVEPRVQVSAAEEYLQAGTGHDRRRRESKIRIAADRHVIRHVPIETKPRHGGIITWRSKIGMVAAERHDKLSGMRIVTEPNGEREAAGELAGRIDDERVRR